HDRRRDGPSRGGIQFAHQQAGSGSSAPFWRSAMSAGALIKTAAGVLAGLALALANHSQAGPLAEQWDSVVHKAINHLKTSQASDGSWSREKSPGVTGVALTGLLSTGKLSPDDPVAAKALKYIESLINPDAHHIAGKDAQVQLQNYVTRDRKSVV